jgi:hypothetical protein
MLKKTCESDSLETKTGIYHGNTESSATPNTHTLPPHPQNPSATEDYCQVQAVFEKEFLGKPKDYREDRNKDTGGN